MTDAELEGERLAILAKSKISKQHRTSCASGRTTAQGIERIANA